MTAPMATRRDNNIIPLQLSPIDVATLAASTTQPIIEEVHNIASGLLSTETSRQHVLQRLGCTIAVVVFDIVTKQWCNQKVARWI